MTHRELYGIDLPVTIRSRDGVYPMLVRVPGWINFGILKARAVPLAQPKRRAS